MTPLPIREVKGVGMGGPPELGDHWPPRNKLKHLAKAGVVGLAGRVLRV